MMSWWKSRHIMSEMALHSFQCWSGLWSTHININEVKLWYWSIYLEWWWDKKYKMRSWTVPLSKYFDKIQRQDEIFTGWEVYRDTVKWRRVDFIVENRPWPLINQTENRVGQRYSQVIFAKSSPVLSLLGVGPSHVWSLKL